MRYITVIVAVYNVEKYIEKCLLSICNQTYSNLEIIVVDDGSTDDSGKICDRIAAFDSRVQVIHKENAGVSSARNIGIKLATGNYITFVDGDDYLDKNMYSSMMELLTSDEVQMSICSFRYVYRNKVKDVKSDFSKDIISQEHYLKSLLKDAFGFYYSVVWNKLISRDVIEKNNLLFDEQWRIMEDFRFVLQLLTCVKRIAVCKDVLYNYRKDNIGTITSRKISFEESFNNRKQGYLWLKECLLHCNCYEKNKKWLGDYLIRYLASQYAKAVYDAESKKRLCEHKTIKKNSFFFEELNQLTVFFKIKRKLYWNIYYLCLGFIDLLRKRKIFVKSICFLLIFYIVIGLYSGLRVTKFEYTNAKIPEEFDGYKIIQISDLHSTVFGKNQTKLIDSIRNENPDMIVITGDMFDKKKWNYKAIEDLLVGISDISPIYAITGNNEYDDKDMYKVLTELYKKYGINLLNDESVEIQREHSSIFVYGIYYRYYILQDYFELEGERNYFNIALYHDPDQFEKLGKKGFDLVLAGHTHGGIVRIPYWGGMIGNGGELFPKYDYGMYYSDECDMYVSTGLGDTKIPRFYNRSEITSITLRKK